MYRIPRVLCILFWALPGLGHAALPLEGCFMATDTCPALHSIKKATNPGNLFLTKGVTYEVTAKNKPNATHYLLKIKGDKIEQRWVAIACGKLLSNCPQPSVAPQPQKQNQYLLAVSWQPAFCEIHRNKLECQNQTTARYDATHLALHGLWPQPKDNAYCNVSTENKSIDRNGHWAQLPKLGLNRNLYDNLQTLMPGTVSYLHRHEWIKHGTCYGDSPETYFQDAIALMQTLNESTVRDFIAANIGKRVTAAEIRAKFDEAFGSGAGNKVNVKCNRKGMIDELWINLQGNAGESSLADLLKAAPATKSKCNAGKVDAAGF